MTATSENVMGARCAEHVEHLHQGPAVLAARQADHDAVAVLDQAMLDDGPGHLRAMRASSGVAVRPCVSGHPAAAGVRRSSARSAPRRSRRHRRPAVRRAAWSSARRASAPASDRGRRIAHEARLAVAHQFRGTAAVAARDDGLRRGEGLDGDQPEVLLERPGRPRRGTTRDARRASRRPRRRAASPVSRAPWSRTSCRMRGASSPSPAIVQRTPAAAGSARARTSRSMRLSGVNRDTANNSGP